MAILDAPEPVNLVRSVFLCNVFTFFFAASKACLFPFLVIYFKKLGLTATQAGIVMGIKTVVAFMFAPLWARCAVRCGKRRFVLMFSLAMMAATYLSLTAVPSMNEQFSVQCHFETSGSVVLPQLPTVLPPETNTTTNLPVQSVSSKKTSPPAGITGSVNNTGGSPENTTVGNPVTNSTVAAAVTSTPRPVVSTEHQTSTAGALMRKILQQLNVSQEALDNMTDRQVMDYMQQLLETEEGEKALLKSMGDLPTDIQDQLYDILSEETKGFGRHGRDLSVSEMWSSFKSTLQNKLAEVKEKIQETEDRMFLVILVILIVGETVSSPAEKVADDSWFEFLESIDDLEKYGLQRIWSTLAYIIMPIIVTVTIDNTSCLFGANVHPFMLHFYMFGGFLAVTFLLSFCYPVSSSKKYKYVSKIGKGFRVVCCSGRGSIFVLTLLIMGVVYASYYNFLFWRLLDLGSKEITLGLCLSLAGLSEIPMLLFSDRLVKKVGNGGIVGIALLCLAARMLYYSFLWTPWAVLPAELTHAFTHTAMWWAVLSSNSFNSSPSVGRSIRSILSSVYFGIGFAVGSFLSGFVYDTYGPSILFQAGSVLTVAWFPVLCISLRCCREKERTDVKYSRLLTSDDHSDDDDSMEDDWLEQALKDK